MPSKKKNQGEPLDNLLKEPPGVYRYTKHGIALRETLAILSREGKITPFLEMWIMKVFDMKMTEKIAQLGDRNKLPTINFQSQTVKKHSFLDGGWEIYLEHVQLHFGDIYKKVNKIKILADNFETKSTQDSKHVKYQLKNKSDIVV